MSPLGPGHPVESKAPPGPFPAVNRHVAFGPLTAPTGTWRDLEPLSAPCCQDPSQKPERNPFSKIRLFSSCSKKHPKTRPHPHGAEHPKKEVHWRVGWRVAQGPAGAPTCCSPAQSLRQAPHRAKVVKKTCILARKVVTEPCRQSFISTSRAKSRGSRTDRCR